jgi:peptidyl-prolyl cis-trans isomerase B (cyclophilin B)
VPSDRQRRQAERRRQARRQQNRAARAARRRRVNLIVSIVGALAVIAVVVIVIVATNNDKSAPAVTNTSPTATSPAPTSSASSSAKVAAYPCTWKKTGTAAKKVSVPPTTTPSRKGTVAVSVGTTHGPMTFTLNRANAPCAVESFVSLARQKYFDQTSCHRLTSASTLHVLQCGDPTGTGSGGPGYSFADELTGKEKYARGTIAMALSGPNTGGSQFFIVYGATQLAPSYTVFGTVTKGLSVVDEVAAKGSTPATDGKPKLPISFTTVTAVK